MKASILSIEGKRVGEISLPRVFETLVEPALIKRAVLSIESAGKQPKGASAGAGRSYTAEYVGARGKPMARRTINVGRARLPRLKNRRELLYGDVKSVPQAVGGPKAHPPKPVKRIAEKINKKEKRKALESAIAATCDKRLVRNRGHRFDEKIDLPIVVEKRFEGLERTREVEKALKALRVFEDIERAKKGITVRAGKGKKRGRRYKRKKSILIVAGEKGSIYRAARNLPGVEVSSVKSLNAKLLAPGARAGRLTVWSESAVKALGEEK